MFKLAKAISALTDELREWREQRQCELATKQDILGSENRIIQTINLVCRPEHEKPRVRFQFAIGLPQNKPKENSMPVAVKITNEQKVTVTLKPVTDTGKPAALDGKPTWEVVSGNATVQVADDGLSAVLVSADDPGDTQFLVKADADLGEGVEEISDVVTLNVVGATAKNLGLAVGTPEPK